MEKNSEDVAKSFEGKCTFSSLFQLLSDYFDMDSRDFDFDSLRNKVNAKVWSIGTIKANLFVVDAIEND